MDWVIGDRRGFLYMAIAFILIMSFFASLSLALPDGITATTYVTRENIYTEPLAITVSSQEIKPGDTLYVTSFTQMPACGQPSVALKIYDQSTNIKVLSPLHYFDSYDGAGQLITTWTIDASKFNFFVDGSSFYIMQDWFCYGVRVDVSTQTDINYFRIDSQASPDEEPVTTCNPSEIMVDGTCVANWDGNDGECWAYEPRETADCSGTNPCDTYIIGNGECEVCEPWNSPDCYIPPQPSPEPTPTCPVGFYIDDNGECIKGYDKGFVIKPEYILIGLGGVLMLVAFMRRRGR